MSSNHELAKFIPDLLSVTDVQNGQSALQKKLFGVVDDVLKKCDLIAARGLRDKHGAIILHALRRSSMTTLVAISKKWNPHRPEPAKNATSDVLIKELTELLHGKQPAEKAKAAAKPSGRRAAGSSAR